MIDRLEGLDVPELEPSPALPGDEATVTVQVARGMVPPDSQLHERHLTASHRARSKRSSTKQVLEKKSSKALKQENEMTRARRERAAAQRAKAAARAAEAQRPTLSTGETAAAPPV